MLTSVDGFRVTIVDVPFNEWLLGKMQENGWTQAELSRRSGLTRQAIANYLNGRVPDDDAKRKLARALKVPLEDIYRASKILPPINERDGWIEQMIYELDDPALTKEDKALLLTIIRTQKQIAAGRHRGPRGKRGNEENPSET